MGWPWKVLSWRIMNIEEFKLARASRIKEITDKPKELTFNYFRYLCRVKSCVRWIVQSHFDETINGTEWFRKLIADGKYKRINKQVVFDDDNENRDLERITIQQTLRDRLVITAWQIKEEDMYEKGCYPLASYLKPNYAHARRLVETFLVLFYEKDVFDLWINFVVAEGYEDEQTNLEMFRKIIKAAEDIIKWPEVKDTIPNVADCLYMMNEKKVREFLFPKKTFKKTEKKDDYLGVLVEHVGEDNIRKLVMEKLKNLTRQGAYNKYKLNEGTFRLLKKGDLKLTEKNLKHVKKILGSSDKGCSRFSQ